MTRNQHAIGTGSALAFATEQLVAPVEGMHRAIAGRWFGALGAVGAPVRRSHDAIANIAYGSVRLGGAAMGFGLDRGMTVESGRADAIQGFVNGLWGDALGRRRDRIEIPMGIRDGRGASVAVSSGLFANSSAVTGRLVVLVHGLVETEQCWNGSETEPSLAEALEEHDDLTPIRIRYNSGLRVSDNGSQLSSLLEEIRCEWPVPVISIALVGHSMGGLVIRSACEAARSVGHRWIDNVEDIVTVGAPHRGSPLEKIANVAAWGLGFAPETKPLADFVNGRSVGIKDLRFGAIVESDWIGTDPDALLRDTVGDHGLSPGIDHHFVAGVVTSDPTHPVGVAVGDLVVRSGSGTAAKYLEPMNAVVVGGKNHFGLLHDPEVIDSIMGWLVPARGVS